MENKQEKTMGTNNLNQIVLQGKELTTVMDLCVYYVESMYDSCSPEELLEDDIWKQFENVNEVIDQLVVIGNCEEPKTNAYLLGRKCYHEQCAKLYQNDYEKIRRPQ